MRLIREFENPDGINGSVRVRVRKALNRERYLLFLANPFRRFPRPEFLADFAVQFVQVGLIEPVTHCTQSLLQSLALLLPNRFVAAFVGEQGLFELRQNVVGNVNVLEYLSQPGAKFFFTEVRQLALAAKSSATVVGVSVFLDFSRYHAIVVGAAEQSRKGKVVLPVLGFVVTPEYGLHLVKQFGAD